MLNYPDLVCSKDLLRDNQTPECLLRTCSGVPDDVGIAEFDLEISGFVDVDPRIHACYCSVVSSTQGEEGENTNGEILRWLRKRVFTVLVAVCVFCIAVYDGFQINHGGYLCVCEEEEEEEEEEWGWGSKLEWAGLPVLCSELISRRSFHGYDRSDSDGGGGETLPVLHLVFSFFRAQCSAEIPRE